MFGVEAEDVAAFEKQSEVFGIDLHYSKDLKRLYVHEKVEITDKFHSDNDIDKHIHFYAEELNRQLDLPAFYSECDLECRFSRVRTEETNLGNFTADIILTEYNADFGLANGGCLRANSVFEKGL